MRPLRIGQVVFSLDQGGMENGLINLSHHLSPLGIEFVFFCLDRPGVMVPRLPAGNLLRCFGQRTGFSWEGVQWLQSCAVNYAVDLLHTHNLGPLIYGGFVRLATHIPLVHGEHAELLPQDFFGRSRYLRLAFFSLAKRGHSVAAKVSRQTEEACLLPPGLVATIPNGVDSRRFRQSGSPPDGPTTILLVGRFGPHKGHETLLAGLELLNPADFQGRVRFVFLGSGGACEEDVRRRSQELADRWEIVFAGYSANPEDWYRRAHLLIVPSKNEGMPNAVLEALSSSLPVLANQRAGVDGIVSDGVDGWIRPLETAAELAQSLREVLPMVRARGPEMGAAGRRKVDLNYSMEAMVQAYASLFRGAVRF